MDKHRSFLGNFCASCRLRYGNAEISVRLKGSDYAICCRLLVNMGRAFSGR